MMQSLRVIFVAFFVLIVSTVAENKYEDGKQKVIVYQMPFEGTPSNLSNTKCVEYTAGQPDDYKKGCLTSIYNINGYTVQCKVSYNDKDCDSCSVCQTGGKDKQYGFKVVCNSFLPSKNIQSDCRTFDSAVIQEYLVDDGHFENVKFNFSSPPPGKGGSGTSSSFNSVFVLLLSLVVLRELH